MPHDPDSSRELRFACTQCGACCNRSPELELSEAAALADVFVFRLMFRLYRLPETYVRDPEPILPASNSTRRFYETKRLLTAFAAGKYATRPAGGRKADRSTSYLNISALTLDTGTGSCTALRHRRCSIYERRPLACRTVPFHYSRAEASAETDLAAFVSRSDYRCDTTARAPIVVEGGRIVDSQARQTRSDALGLAERDRSWKQAILRQLKADERNASLPSLREVEANYEFGAMTTSMRVAWQIAVSAGLMSAQTCRTLIAAQAAVIGRELASPNCTAGTRATLNEMRAEHAQLLET